MTEYSKENAYQIINVKRYSVCKAEHFGEKKKKIMKIVWEIKQLVGCKDLENAAMEAAIFVSK